MWGLQFGGKTPPRTAAEHGEQAAGASLGVSYQTVLSPLVTIVLSAWLLDEPLTGGLFLGGSLVIAGVYAGALVPDGHGG